MATKPPGRTGAKLAADNDTRCKADLMGFLRELAREHGDVAAFNLPRGRQLARCVLVSGPEAAREVLMRREPWLRKPEWVKASNRGHWGDGLTTLEGPVWRERRSMLQPLFRAAAVAARQPVVQACTLHMLGSWPREGAIDLVHELRLLTARIAARTLFDADIAGFDDAHAHERAGLLSVEEAYGDTFVGHAEGSPWVMVRPRAPARIDGILRLIDARLDSGERRGDLLSGLIHARAPGGAALSRDEIVGELVQMLYAGHLTIPASLAQLWRDLHAHAVEPQPRGDQAQWLRLIKESMRLHAPAPLLYREVERPFDLAGVALRPDDAVWVAAQGLHDDPRCFDEPTQFWPHRFEDAARPVRAGTWLPFGAGPRTCVGNHQAMRQMALIAQTVSRQFALTPQPAGAAGFFVQARGGDGSECFRLTDTTGTADHNPTEEN